MRQVIQILISELTTDTITTTAALTPAATGMEQSGAADIILTRKVEAINHYLANIFLNYQIINIYVHGYVCQFLDIYTYIHSGNYCINKTYDAVKRTFITYKKPIMNVLVHVDFMFIL